MRYSIFRFATPPFALMESKYASAPRDTDGYEAAGPVSGAVPPTKIVVALIPGSAAEPASATGIARSAVARATTSADGRLIVGASFAGALLRTRVAVARDQLPDSAEETTDAIRDDEHEQDQDDAVDDRGAARLLRLLDDPGRQKRAQGLSLRPERQEGDEDR